MKVRVRLGDLDTCLPIMHVLNECLAELKCRRLSVDQTARAVPGPPTVSATIAERRLSLPVEQRMLP